MKPISCPSRSQTLTRTSITGRHSISHGRLAPASTPRHAISDAWMARASRSGNGTAALDETATATHNSSDNSTGNGSSDSGSSTSNAHINTAAVLLPTHSPEEVFICPEESLFYSQCLERLLLARPDVPPTIVEFGAGDGSPVISALLKTPSQAQATVVHAFETNTAAAELARSRAGRYGVASSYRVHTGCFFKGAAALRAEGEDDVQCLISNPPYLPAEDPSGMLMPALHGGCDGAELTRELLSLRYDSAMLLLSAFSNPVDTIRHAQREGYMVKDFMATPLPFGTYSSQPMVKQHIAGMKERGQAFYAGNTYLLAGVLFERRHQGLNKQSDGSTAGSSDLSEALLQVLTALC